VLRGMGLEGLTKHPGAVEELRAKGLAEAEPRSPAGPADDATGG
jgi:hypothetical protein